MKALRTSLLLSIFALGVSCALGAGTPGRVPLPAVPEIGAVIKTRLDVVTWQVVDAVTVAPAFQAIVGQSEFTVSLDQQSRAVIWVSTQATGFVTSEMVSVRTTVADVLAKFPNAVVDEKGFGTYVNLPSGWSAFLQREGKPVPTARVLYFFKRRPPAKP